MCIFYVLWHAQIHRNSISTFTSPGWARASLSYFIQVHKIWFKVPFECRKQSTWSWLSLFWTQSAAQCSPSETRLADLHLSCRGQPIIAPRPGLSHLEQDMRCVFWSFLDGVKLSCSFFPDSRDEQQGAEEKNEKWAFELSPNRQFESLKKGKGKVISWGRVHETMRKWNKTTLWNTSSFFLANDCEENEPAALKKSQKVLLVSPIRSTLILSLLPKGSPARASVVLVLLQGLRCKWTGPVQFTLPPPPPSFSCQYPLFAETKCFLCCWSVRFTTDSTGDTGSFSSK